MNTPQIAVEIESDAAQVVASLGGREFTRGELSAAFDAVANKANWKAPIDAVGIFSESYQAAIAVAVEFFAGCKPTFTPINDSPFVHVEAVGYYEAIGA